MFGTPKFAICLFKKQNVVPQESHYTLWKDKHHLVMGLTFSVTLANCL